MMKQSKSPRTLCVLFFFAVSLLFCVACDNHHEHRGLDWQPPGERSLPFGFGKSEKVPAYAKGWHMPPGFRGFPARWNERVAHRLQESCKHLHKECLDAVVEGLKACPGGKAYQSALIQRRAAWQKHRILHRRRAEGDYLVFLNERDLPCDLRWQDGSGQPELGSPKAIKGGTMRIALQRSFPNTLRPFGPNSNNATRRYVYDDIDLPLTRIHPGTGGLIPGTADRWAVSKDGRTVYFHIDPKARFSDGSPLRAKDFITSLYVRTSEYSMEPFYGDYYINNFSRIAVYGNETIAVTLPAPKPHAAFYAAVPASCTRFYAEFGPDYPTRYLWRPAPTTGGYEVDPNGVVMGQRLALKRVKNWWAEDRPYTRYSCNVSGIVYQFVMETSKVKELFRIGQLDVFSARDSDFWYEGLEIDPVHRGLVQRVHFNNIWPRNCFGLHLNCSVPPLDDINVRKGIHHAMNVQSVINTIFRGDYVRMGSFFSGFGPYTDGNLRALPYDPAKARSYFAKAGYTVEGGDGILSKKDGTRLQLVVSSRIDPLYANCLGLLRAGAARCGLDLRVEQMDDTIFYLKVKDKMYAAAVWSWGFSPPMPDPGQFYLSRYARNSDGSPLKGSANITATASPELDAAILDVQASRTEQQAVRNHHRVQQLIAGTASWVPGWTTTFWRFAQWRWVRWPEDGAYPFCPPRYYDPMDSHLYWIDPDIMRETLKARVDGSSFPEIELNIPLPKK